MKYDIRNENKSDWYEVEVLTREAFWNKQKCSEHGIGCDEHYLLHLLRQYSGFVKELDFVAQLNNCIIGNIVYTKAWIKEDNVNCQEVLTFGPISVLPKFQRQGCGSELVIYSMEAATRMGFGAVIIYGHPSYYPKFGFQDASEFCITTPEGKNFPAFMVKELKNGFLKNITGTFHLPEIFNIKIDDAIKFNKNYIQYIFPIIF